MEIFVAKSLPFGDILEAAGQLSFEDQQELVTILRRRLIQAGRQRIAAEVREANQELSASMLRPSVPEELMHEILK